ncbi:Zn finger-containing GTPase- Activating Protein for ARF [Onygenales sp. PD_12]|nr:Zn finger-containing GTPase- Activating Protein for ARF [Emmonsiellopsis sp. PD_33]KAK2778669.1 Zn finger-containing GTPase- Activating Protein for ARF [Onygenales sp. PD_12]KAK2788333.1 Zn finger-containing GTPase- Activating Protein for ARF [Onygenales sp. PD_10]
MSKMWEVDPETRSKASPKFGTFICLNCAGTHRGLGVHISFVRSITMDAFKLAEIQRMEHGGNDPFKTFFDEHSINASAGRSFEGSSIKERYEGAVGEEWKARLTAKVEGREYVPGEEKVNSSVSRAATPGRSMSPATGATAGAKQELHVAGNGGTQKERNETYFASLGAENASRPENVAPSQGGKYAGFGGGMPPSSQQNGRGAGGGGGGPVPGLNDFQNDPVAALTKGFGWFTTTVGRGAKTVNESYLAPAAKTLAQSDLAAQARLAATEVSRNLQTGTRGAAETFNRFVEGPQSGAGAGAGARGFEPERKDFWDDFATLGEEREKERERRSGAVGTMAMRGSGGNAGAGMGMGMGMGASAGAAGGGAGVVSRGNLSVKEKETGKGKGKEKDDWDDNW